MDQPLGLCLTILELRTYARAKAALDGAESESDVEGMPMADAVLDTAAAIHADRVRARAGA